MKISPITRFLLTLPILLFACLSMTIQANAGSCTNNCLSVYSLGQTDLGTSIRATIKVVDESVSSRAAKSAMVQGMWTRPDGSTVLQYASIGTRLRADFNFGTGGIAGTYTFEVIDIVKSGYTFDPSSGVELVSSLSIQNSYNQPPTAVINTDRLAGAAPLSINFDALSSHDPDGVIASYLWNFGDGTTAYDPSPSHTYSVSGNYTATLSVLDDVGARASAGVAIYVTEASASATAGCQQQCLSIDAFKMNLRKDKVIGKVRVLDEIGETVYDVTIGATWTLPDGSSVTQTRQNGSRKQTVFRMPATQPGTYTLSVTHVTKAGYQYDPANNKADAADYLVQ